MEDAAPTGSKPERSRDWIRIAAIVQAICALALTVITSWYASLTNDLLHAQAQPELDVSLDEAKTELVLENTGSVAIVDVRIDLETHVFVRKSRFIGSRNRLRCPNERRLNSGKTVRCPLASVASAALKLGQQIGDEGLLGDRTKGAPAESIVVARVGYRREVDRKAFKTTLAFRAECCGPNDEVILMGGGWDVPRDVDDAIRDVNPSLEGPLSLRDLQDSWLGVGEGGGSQAPDHQ